MSWLNDLLNTLFSSKKDEVEELLISTEKERDDLKLLVDDMDETIQNLEFTILTMTKKLERNVLDYKEQYIAAHETSPYLYDYKRNGQRLDIKEALEVTTTGLETIKILSEEIFKGKHLRSSSDVIEVIMKYFADRSNWRYVYDKDQFGKIEFWQLAEISATTRKGDCDDLAILMYALGDYSLRTLGYEEHVWRLELVTAKILGEGGHCFNRWLGDIGHWFVVESTYDLPGSLRRTWLKTPMIYNNMYEKMYAFATNQKSWRGSISSLRNIMDEDR